MSIQEQLKNCTSYTVKHIDGLTEMAYRILSQKSLSHKETMFFGRDMKIDLGLLIIKVVRKLPDNDRKKILSTTDAARMNKIINGIFRPELN